MIVWLFAAPPSAVANDTITGAATILDGDTLEVDGSLIHLHGIDAPEAGQVCAIAGEPSPCGRAATDLLRRLTAGQVLTCREVGRDSDGRIVGKCKAGWMDLGAEMVTMGMAVADLGASHDYLQNYREARGKGNGIFAGEFVAPARWRAGERHPVEIAGDSVPRRCDIKGAVDAAGERVYLQPGQPAYAATRINPMAGERWFCSEAEARAAGWRAIGQ